MRHPRPGGQRRRLTHVERAELTTDRHQAVTLALLGVHIVGSSNGHPEMLWATFEHFGNTPNAKYQYGNRGSTTATVPQNTSGTWTLTSSNAAGPFNFLGTTWTMNGAPPSTSYSIGGNEIGTSYPSNSTMATYQQWMSTASPGNHCLDCHQSSSPSIASTDVSHIFGSLAPLFTPSSILPKKGS